MAAMTRSLLHLGPNLHPYCRPHSYPLHHFSSTSDHDPQSESPKPDFAAQTSFSSKFDEIKVNLKREPPPQNRLQPPRNPLSLSSRNTSQNPPPSRAAGLDEIRQNLSKFRARSAAPPPQSSGGGEYISLRELYRSNVDGSSATSSDSPNEKPSVNPAARGKFSFHTIRESLRQIKGAKPIDSSSIARIRDSLKLSSDPNYNPDSQDEKSQQDMKALFFESHRWNGYPELILSPPKEELVEKKPTTINNSSSAGNGSSSSSSLGNYDEQYKALDNLDFMKAAKILFSDSPKKKKFGLDFHLVQLFFVCLPSLAVYLVAQYARSEMRKMDAFYISFELERKKQAEFEAQAKEMELKAAEEKEAAASNPAILEVKERLNKLEEAVKETVVESKRQLGGAMRPGQQDKAEQKQLLKPRRTIKRKIRNEGLPCF